MNSQLQYAENRICSWFQFHTIHGATNLITKTTINRICGFVGACDMLIDSGVLSEQEGWFIFNSFNPSEPYSGKRFQIPLTFVRAVYERDKYCCVYCGLTSSKDYRMLRRGELSIDHIKPITRMPRQAVEDLATACIECNMQKTNRTPEEFGLLPTFLSDGLRYENQMILGGYYGR